MLTPAKPWPQVREDVPVALTSIGEHAATVAMRAICSCRLYLEVCTLPLTPHAGLCRSLIQSVERCRAGEAQASALVLDASPHA